MRLGRGRIAITSGTCDTKWFRSFTHYPEGLYIDGFGNQLQWVLGTIYNNFMIGTIDLERHKYPHMYHSSVHPCTPYYKRLANVLQLNTSNNLIRKMLSSPFTSLCRIEILLIGSDGRRLNECERKLSLCRKNDTPVNSYSSRLPAICVGFYVRGWITRRHQYGAWNTENPLRRTRWRGGSIDCHSTSRNHISRTTHLQQELYHTQHAVRINARNPPSLSLSMRNHHSIPYTSRSIRWASSERPPGNRSSSYTTLLDPIATVDLYQS